MQDSISEGWIKKIMVVVIAAIIMVMPFHALLSVWISQLIGHYTALRLWKEFLLIPLTLGALYLLAKDARCRTQFLHSKLVWLIGVYLFLELVSGIVALLTHHVSPKALGYGWISDTRYLIFFLVVWVVAAQVARLKSIWPKLVFWPAAVVVIFGLLQYFVFPYNFMSHLGYNSLTIFPYEDINHNIYYIRIMSTLRGANPLGAYLVVVLCLLLATWYKRRKWWLIALGTGSTLALVLTFSRGAWIGLVLSVIGLLLINPAGKHVSRLALSSIGLGVLIVLGVGFTALHHNTTFENLFFHTQTHSAVKTNSNQGHTSALQSGFSDVIHEPLGQGPGTAGPASVYNTGHPSRIAEDYFIQIAQEVGWLGLALFLLINGLVAYGLWQQRQQMLAIGLLAAFIGISFINLLSHAWADDTLAYIWWGLAGIAYVSLLSRPANSASQKNLSSALQ